MVSKYKVVLHKVLISTSGSRPKVRYDARLAVQTVKVVLGPATAHIRIPAVTVKLFSTRFLELYTIKLYTVKQM